MNRPSPRKLLALLENPVHNKDDISRWPYLVKKLAADIIRDSTLIGARDWDVACDLEKVLTQEVDWETMSPLESELLGYVQLGEGENCHSSRFLVCREMVGSVFPEPEDGVPLELDSNRWLKAWQSFASLSSSLNGSVDRAMTPMGLMFLSFHLLKRETKAFSELSQRQVDEYIRAAFASERARMKTLVANCQQAEPTEPTLEASLNALKTWAHENSDHIEVIMRSLGYSVARL